MMFKPFPQIVYFAKIRPCGTHARLCVTIEYRSGKSNVDADALSRVCFNSSQVSTYSLSEYVVHAICLSHVTPFLGVDSLYRVPSFGDIGSETICLTQMVTSSLKSMNTQMLRDEQLKDPALTSLI